MARAVREPARTRSALAEAARHPLRAWAPGVRRAVSSTVRPSAAGERLAAAVVVGAGWDRGFRRRSARSRRSSRVPVGPGAPGGRLGSGNPGGGWLVVAGTGRERGCGRGVAGSRRLGVAGCRGCGPGPWVSGGAGWQFPAEVGRVPLGTRGCWWRPAGSCWLSWVWAGIVGFWRGLLAVFGGGRPGAVGRRGRRSGRGVVGGGRLGVAGCHGCGSGSRIPAGVG